MMNCLDSAEHVELLTVFSYTAEPDCMCIAHRENSLSAESFVGQPEARFRLHFIGNIVLFILIAYMLLIITCPVLYVMHYSIN